MEFIVSSDRHLHAMHLRNKTASLRMSTQPVSICFDFEFPTNPYRASAQHAKQRAVLCKCREFFPHVFFCFARKRNTYNSNECNLAIPPTSKQSACRLFACTELLPSVSVAHTVTHLGQSVSVSVWLLPLLIGCDGVIAPHGAVFIKLRARRPCILLCCARHNDGRS